jgi:hypothetical protein
LTHAVLSDAQPSDGASRAAHNWDLWSRTLDQVISFHQSAHGPASKPELDPVFVRSDEALLSARAAETANRVARINQRAEQLRASLPGVSKELAELRVPTHRPFETESVARLRDGQKNAGAVVDQARAELDALAAEGDSLPPFAREQRLAAVENKLKAPFVAHRAALLGNGPEPISTNPAGLRALPEPVQANINALLERMPEARDALAQLANRSPQLLGTNDALTKAGGTFAKQLNEHVANGFLKTDAERAGFVEFIRRIAHREWNWRSDGYSHTVTSATAIPFNHPGLILDLIEAARTGKPMRFKPAYKGDTATPAFERGDPSLGDFVAGFGRVDQTRDLPAARLGYERGFLRLVRDTLAPKSDRLPPNWFGVTCGPIAVAMSKLLGKEVQYGYLHNLTTGADVVEALKSQGPYGLALADAWVKVGDGPTTWLHFPQFSDFDPKTNTVELQEWTRGRQRVKVDELSFVGERNARRGEPQPPAGYFLVGPGHEGINAFWTPEFEPKKGATAS